jgi:hypothetical protein
MPEPEARDLVSLLRNLGGAQASNTGWPLLHGKYITYLRFKKEWWAYRKTCHVHVRNKFVCWTLQEKCLGTNLKALVGDMEELDKVWDRLVACYDQPEKYIAEALIPTIKFRKCMIF